jgi:DNA invertase Pin-like site-specific DNA recombinase
MKAVILARVSTEEQRDAGNSLPAQIERIRNYCGRSHLDVTDERIFSFDESAYKTKRDEFDKILDYLDRHKEKVAVCFDKVDRLSRNVFDKRVSLLYEKAIGGDIELHFVSDGQIINTEMSAVQKFQFGMSLGLAKYYSDAISDNVKRAYETKRRSGEWIGRAPIGYKNITLDSGPKDIVFDEEREHHIRRIFELYATGNFSIRKIRHEITQAGLLSPQGKVLATSMIEHILKNPFYYGVAKSNDNLYPHKYRPLVTKELWGKCQQVLSGWSKKPFQYAAKPYIFRGLLRCAHCGCAMSPETHKTFIYYVCTNAKGICKRIYVSENELLKPIHEILQALDRMSQDRVNDVVAGLRKSHESKEIYHGTALVGLRKEYDVIQQRLKRLYMDHLDGRLTQHEYDGYLHEFKSRQQEIDILLEERTEADERYYIAASTVLNLARRALEIFESSEVLQKRALLNFMLQNSVVDGKIPRYVLRSPFDAIYAFAKQPTGLPQLDTFRTVDWRALERELQGLTAVVPAIVIKC